MRQTTTGFELGGGGAIAQEEVVVGDRRRARGAHPTADRRAAEPRHAPRMRPAPRRAPGPPRARRRRTPRRANSWRRGIAIPPTSSLPPVTRSGDPPSATARRRGARRRGGRDRIPATARRAPAARAAGMLRCTGPGGSPSAVQYARQASDLIHRSRSGPASAEVGLEEPPDRVSEQLQLVDRLPGADLAQLRRPVGGEDDQRHPRLVGLDHGGQQVGGSGPGGARDDDRSPRGLRRAEREESGAALVDVRPAAQALVAREREDDRRIARARRGAGVLHPASDELVDQRSEEQVAVVGLLIGSVAVICRSRS